MRVTRRAVDRNTPIIVNPAQTFLSDEGAWSTYTIAVGSPLQNFLVLPSTQVSETWLVLPEGCSAPNDTSTCAASRGVLLFNGETTGFESAQSGTWNEIGLFGITTEQYLGNYDLNAVFGTDVLTINGGNGSAGGVSLAGQTIGGIAAKSPYLGVFGLSVDPSNFNSSQNYPTFLENLYRYDLIPSLSYSYTAGALYIQSQQTSLSPWGSLVLGGYDTTRFNSNKTLSLPLSENGSRGLTVSVESILASNVTNGTVSMTSSFGSFVATIDTTQSQFWLPRSVCDVFEANLNLTYHDPTGFYILSRQQHNSLIVLNPLISFSLGPDRKSTSNNSSSFQLPISISFPYSSLDLQLGLPIFNESVYYFPIRRAANASQYVLGRAFLQQTHLIVDYGRRNFSLSPAVFPNSNVGSNLVAITSEDVVTIGSGSNGSRAGAIAGGVVGGILGLILIVLAVFFYRRRQSQAKTNTTSKPFAELDGSQSVDSNGNVVYAKVHEAGGDQVNELPTIAIQKDALYEAPEDPRNLAELPSPSHPQIYEMEGEGVLYPLDNKSSRSESPIPRHISPASQPSNNSQVLSPVSAVFHEDASQISTLRSQHSPGISSPSKSDDGRHN